MNKEKYKHLEQCWAMALPVMEFEDQGYKIRKNFEKNSTYPKEIIKF